MARKIVGLDIGSHSIKVVTGRERFGKVEILEVYERPVNGEGVHELIKSMVSDRRIRPDIVVSSIPGSSVSVHYLNIPFTDETKIGQVVPYEVEGLIPFPLDEMVIDQFILSKNNGNGGSGSNGKGPHGSSVCVALINKNILKDHLDTLRSAHIEPGVIELEPLALYQTLMEWHKTDDTVAVLDIGASRSNLCIVSKGKPVSLRTFNRGGNVVTYTVQESLGITYEEAEQRKIAAEILNYEVAVSREQAAGAKSEDETETLSNAIKKGLQPIIIELNQTLHAFEIQNNNPVTILYITGGGARVGNIKNYLSNILGRDVEYLSIPTEVAERLGGGEGRGPENTRFISPTGIGLVLRGSRKKEASGLNFRKGEYFHRKEIKENTGKIIYLIVTVVILILLGTIDFYSMYHYRETRYEALKSDIRKAYIETFPESKNVVDEFHQMKSAVDDLRKKVVALGGGTEKGMSPLELMNIMSEKIPKEIKVNIDDLLIDKSKVRLQGDTDSFENVEKIKKEFEAVPLFKKVDVADAKLGADQKKVKFRIVIDM
ncbi:MAG: pilus assembly protein PilM [Nitrospirae bacterium]|nr:pilus assembly protein PilM [Nitrospirota bacterium]